MAQAPDGKSPTPERVVFTRPAAQRIARVVRTVESGDRSQEGLVFDRQVLGRTRSLRRATFSGAWAIGSTNTVTFISTPTATASVENLSWPITNAGYVNEDCLVGKAGTSWYLVVPVLQASTAVFVTQTQAGQRLVSIALSASLNTNSCAITVHQTPTTASMTLITQTATAHYLRLRVP